LFDIVVMLKLLYGKLY